MYIWRYKIKNQTKQNLMADTVVPVLLEQEHGIDVDGLEQKFPGSHMNLFNGLSRRNNSKIKAFISLSNIIPHNEMLWLTSL